MARGLFELKSKFYFIINVSNSLFEFSDVLLIFWSLFYSAGQRYQWLRVMLGDLRQISLKGFKDYIVYQRPAFINFRLAKLITFPVFLALSPDFVIARVDFRFFP